MYAFIFSICQLSFVEQSLPFKKSSFIIFLFAMETHAVHRFCADLNASEVWKSTVIEHWRCSAGSPHNLREFKFFHPDKF